MGFLVALQFLTIIPIRRSFSAEEIGRCAGYFPVVGAVIGLILAGINYVFSLVLPLSVVSALLIVSMVVLSGALHLDGLIDTCDGIAGDKTPEERWRVMDDSRAGGFGVIGAVLLLLVKYASLSSVPQNWMMFVLVLAPVVSRWTMVYAIFAYPYAKPSGLGKTFKQGMRWQQLVMASLITVVAALALFQWSGLVILTAVWVLVVAVAFYLKQKFAGLTGDTYGAINEIAEVGVFLLFSLLAYRQQM